MQAAKAPPSSEHSKLEPVSLEAKAKLAEFDWLAAPGCVVIEVSGAVMSYVHVRVAGVASTLPVPSVARTASVWTPLLRPAGRCGDSQSAQAPPSSAHSKLTSASSAENVKVASWVGPEVGGPEAIVVCGAVASTVQVCSAGVASSTPSARRARTARVCSPSASAPTACGLVHALKAAPSSAHSNVTPGWSEEKVKLGGSPSSSVSGRATTRQA